MLSRLGTIRLLRISQCLKIPNCNTSDLKEKDLSVQQQNDLVINKNLLQDDLVDVKYERKSVLEECTDDISHVAPYLKSSFNLAAYVNKSETLQQLIKMGVNLHKIENKTNAAQFLLSLDFERDVKKYVMFFHDLGLTVDDIANAFTKNPYILQKDLDNLKVRINYLLYKKFNEDGIIRIVSKNPFWLMFSTDRIDNRLGFFQGKFDLLGDEVRGLATRQPKLITYNLQHVKKNIFTIKEEMGFNPDEMKSLLLNKPNLFMMNPDKILNTFEYLHNQMNITLETISKVPEILTFREFRLKQRHLFLKELGRDQYDPKKPNYISLPTLLTGDNGEFSVNVAKSSLIAFNTFLKTL
ncbi:transcription termination factor 3, mitochondrial [Onthophagus taurus]|uniref:transcription termination factor 3, mitochondrial n=1 Tax=Onthophagus taurus TaxID=166361 RepID=UPI0039BDC87C